MPIRWRYGERRVLELIAANAPLERTLQAVVRLIEQLHPDTAAALMLVEGNDRLRSGSVERACRPAPLDVLAQIPLGTGSGPCGAAASLGRQVVVSDVRRRSAVRRAQTLAVCPRRCAPAAPHRSSPPATGSTARSPCISTPRAARRPRSSISLRGSRSSRGSRSAASRTKPRSATARRVSARCSTTWSTASFRRRRRASYCP